jgi:periplasmic protein TonB
MHALFETEGKAALGASRESTPTCMSLNRTMAEKQLFADALLESGADQRKRRASATVVSVIVQCLLVATIILIPLWFTDALPQQQLVTFLVAPPPPPPPAPAAPEAATRKVVKLASDIANGQLRTPRQIPQTVQIIREDDAPPRIAADGVVGGVPGGIPGGQLGGVIGGIISSSSNLAALPKPAASVLPSVQRVRISPGITRGLLSYQTDPAYPSVARAAHIQGAVVLTAIIDKDGKIENLQLLAGHPLLAPAAIDAVKQWRYKPFLLNGQPVEVETTITVTFRLEA